jgi:hypothetical protein
LTLRDSAQQPAVLNDDAQPQQAGRRFGRFRPAPDATPAKTVLDGRFKLRIPDPAPAALTVAEAAEPAVLPFDSTRVFVGPNDGYYDERWRWMEWRGRNRSWNWAAALSFGGWLAYRRLYAAAAAYLAWLGMLVLMVLHHVFLPLTVVAQLVVAVAVGLYGNRLYQASFRRAALEVAKRHEEYALRVDALAARGGVDRRAVWLWALAAAGVAGLLAVLSGQDWHWPRSG